MDFKSGKELLALCAQQGCAISQVMRRRECVVGETAADEVEKRMARVLEIMRASTRLPLKTPQRSMGGLIGGEAKRLAAHAAKKRDICGPVLQRAVTYAMAVLEVNTSMGLIVAAPTAGSSGVVPALLLALQEQYHISDERLLDGLFNAGAVGYLAMRNATVAGAVGGLVEYPCQSRNAAGVANALVAAELALSGVPQLIPFDEMLTAMYRVGVRLPAELRETALGGCAATPSACERCGGCGG